MIKRIIAASLICLAGATAAFPASELGDKREADMKKIGGAMAQLAGIAKGEKPYDAGVVKTSLTTVNTTIKEFPGLFPEGKPDEDGHASPKIWENMKGFKGHADELASVTDKLLAAPPADQKAVGGAMGAMGKVCSACHEEFRLKK
jgi:cytochrome c556